MSEPTWSVELHLDSSEAAIVSSALFWHRTTVLEKRLKADRANTALTVESRLSMLSAEAGWGAVETAADVKERSI